MTFSPSANGAALPRVPVVPPDLYGSSGSSSFNSSDAGKWEESLKKVVPAIVVIRVCLCSAFDGDRASYSHATGFVVDKARGIILTNRHVVTSGTATQCCSSVSGGLRCCCFLLAARKNHVDFSCCKKTLFLYLVCFFFCFFRITFPVALTLSVRPADRRIKKG